MDDIRFEGWRDLASFSNAETATILESFCFLESCKCGSLYNIPVWQYSTETVLFETDREEIHFKEFSASYSDQIEIIRAAFSHAKDEIMKDPKNISLNMKNNEQGTDFGLWGDAHLKSLARARIVLEEKRDTGTFIQCRKCKSSEVDTDQKQTRSADEPMTIFCQCRKCGTRFRMD
jgi:DNA-directed RNA polymerase subunit M/transcription elongation factor TFIIS